MFFVIIPVLVPLLLARGLTMADVFALQAAYSVAVVVLEIPTGYFCDRFGRKRTILLGALFNAIGFFIVAASQGLGWLYMAELCLGIGWSLVSGADVALIYDILDARGGDREARRQALASYQLALVLGEASASLIGGGLAGWSLAAAAWGSAVASLAPLGLAALLRAPVRAKPSRRNVAADLRAVGHHVLGVRPQRLLFLNMTVWGLSTFIAVWLLQPYWTMQGVGLRWFGVLWGATLVTVGVTAKLTPTLERAIGPRRLACVLTGAPVLAYASMAGTVGGAGIAGGFLFYVSRGISAVFLRERFNHAVPSELRATCNSLASGSFRLAFIATGPLIGMLTDRAGLLTTLWCLAALFAATFALAAVPLLKMLPSRP